MFLSRACQNPGGHKVFPQIISNNINLNLHTDSVKPVIGSCQVNTYNSITLIPNINLGKATFSHTCNLTYNDSTQIDRLL